MDREWSCCGGGHFNGGIKVMLQRWCLMEGAWSCYRENSGGRIVMLLRWPV